MSATDMGKLANEAGKYLSMKFAEGLAENSKFATEAFEGMLEKLKYQRDFDIISEEDYYRKLEILRDKYFTQGTQNWVKYTEQIYEYQKSTLETEKKNIVGLYDEVADYAVKRMDEVIEKQQKMAEKLNDTGALFKTNKVRIGGKTEYYYSLGDLDNDIAAIKKYGDAMEEIEKRAESLGVGEEAESGLIAAIRDLNFEDASGFMSALLSARDDEFAKYTEALSVKGKLSENIAAKQYEDEFEKSWEDACANMRERLKEAGYEIPEDFTVSGSVSAEKFGAAFIEELDVQLQAVRARIEEFNESLKADIDISSTGNIYNTNNTSYNISVSDGDDTVEQIKRFETVKRLSGVKT